jgi:hypothetical protein
MARDAVWRLLVGDEQLPVLMGVVTATAARKNISRIARETMKALVIPNFAADQRPGDGTKPFMVIRWGADEYDPAFLVGFRRFDLYVHIPWDASTDFNRIDLILNRCDKIFESANAVEQSPAGDEYVLHFIEREGRSGDFKDDGYETICRYASYKALSSKAYQVESAIGGSKRL